MSRTQGCTTALIAASLTVVWLACSPEPPPTSPTPRLVLLYATCSLNRDFLAPYDPEISYTPALAEFARRGLVFERHQTESGQSGIAFASLFTGTQAPEHGIYRHPNVLGDENLLITESFAAAGFETHSWLGHLMAYAGLNYAQGVDEQNVHEGLLGASDTAFRDLLTRLRDNPELRAFVVTNFTVTHGPYRDDEVDRFCGRYPRYCERRGDREALQRDAAPYRLKTLALSWDFDRAVQELGLTGEELKRLIEVTEFLYTSNVWKLDRLFGDVIGAIREHGLLEESLIAFTADHGEILHRENAHFFWTHGYQLAPEVLTVPLVLYGPSVGVRPGRYTGVTRSTDVFPTLAGLSGVPLPERDGRGVDLSATLRGEEPRPELTAFSHTSLMKDAMWEQYRNYQALAELTDGMDPAAMWVSARRGDEGYRLQRLPGRDWEVTLSDLSRDPSDDSNLFDPGDSAHRAMAEELRSYKRLLEGDARESILREEPISEARNVLLLKLLGYIE